jgi:hypothetical protein
MRVSSQPQRSLLFLDSVSFRFRGGPVSLLYFGALLSKTLVDQDLGIVAAACGLVHEALRMAFFESGDDFLACWMSLLDRCGEDRERDALRGIERTHGILRVQVRMHVCRL